MTLTEFLLVRIAEDESHLPEGHDCWYPPERYATECEAKRQIVEAHPIRLEPSDGRLIADWWECRTCRLDMNWCPTLRALAAIYADHPDYRDEWRP